MCDGATPHDPPEGEPSEGAIAPNIDEEGTEAVEARRRSLGVMGRIGRDPFGESGALQTNHAGLSADHRRISMVIAPAMWR